MISFIVRTPFGFFFAYIVIGFGFLCNYAILTVEGKNGTGNLRKSHLRNIAGGIAEGVQRGRRRKIHHIPKIIGFKVFSGFNAQAGHRHIGDAISHRRFENVGDFFFGYAVQEAVFHAVKKVGEIVGDVVLYGISRRRLDGNGKGFLVVQLSEGAFQRVDHFCRVFVPHLPNGNSAGKAAGMRVGNIEVVDKPLAALVGILKNGNAVRPTIDPSPKLLVPVVDLKNGGGVRSLCVYQKLLVKAQTVVVAGRAQKRFPACGVCNDRFAGSVIQLRNEVVFSCHRRTPPYRS